jgi:hypothetical protein
LMANSIKIKIYKNWLNGYKSADYAFWIDIEKLFGK